MNGLLYLSTIVIKKIGCNFDNMTVLNKIKESKY